ncbi:hypothetical protein LJY25_03430 [Hymenobacter sp. BT175]|nr:hypothetical protein [Hymenobacter translucens]
MYPYPNEEDLEMLALFPELLNRPFGAIAPLSGRIGLSTNARVRPNKAVTASDEEAAGQPPHEFPANTPIRLMGAYVAFLEAATRQGLSVASVSRLGARLYVWLEDGEEMAQVSFDPEFGDTPVLAEVLQATTRPMADTTFELLRSLQKAPGTWDHPAAHLPVTYVSGIHQPASVTVRDMCKHLRVHKKARTLTLDNGDDTLQGMATCGFVPPGVGFWLVDGRRPVHPGDTPTGEITGLHVLFLRQESGTASTPRTLLDRVWADPLLTDIVLVGFYGNESPYLTLIVQLGPESGTDASRRYGLIRYLTTHHCYGDTQGHTSPVQEAYVEDPVPQEMWRPFIVYHCWEYLARPGIEDTL